MHVISRMPWHGNPARLRRMLVLTMASLRLDVNPSVFLNRPDEIANFHSLPEEEFTAPGCSASLNPLLRSRQAVGEIGDPV